MTHATTYPPTGRCHNAEPGTYGHECGKPAVWYGTTRSTVHPGTPYTTEYCDNCKQHGTEARTCHDWQRIPLPPEA